MAVYRGSQMKKRKMMLGLRIKNSPIKRMLRLKMITTMTGTQTQ